MRKNTVQPSSKERQWIFSMVAMVVDGIKCIVLKVTILYRKAILGVKGWGETTLADEMNFGMNHAPGAGLITAPINLQLNMLTLFYNSVARKRNMP